MMNRRCFRGFFLLIPVIVAGVAALLALAVHSLWNGVLTDVTGVKAITYWQALGLLGLSWLLFGGPRAWFGGHHGYWRHRMRERWDAMTPEERERFREGMAHRCGHRRAPVAETKA